MLMIGESYNDRKAHLSRSIAASREIIKRFRTAREHWLHLDISSVIVIEQRAITDALKELKDVNRWRTRMKLAPDEAWYPPTTGSPLPLPVDLSALWEENHEK